MLFLYIAAVSRQPLNWRSPCYGRCLHCWNILEESTESLPAAEMLYNSHSDIHKRITVMPTLNCDKHLIISRSPAWDSAERVKVCIKQCRLGRHHKIKFHGQTVASLRCTVSGLGVNRQSLNLISHLHGSATEMDQIHWTDIVHVWFLCGRRLSTRARILRLWNNVHQLFEITTFQLARSNVLTKNIANK